MYNDIEKYGENGRVIYHGDALKVLKSLPNESVDLIFVDPPYNIGKNFAGRKDKWETDEDYLNWCYQWIDLCIEKLKPFDTLFLGGFHDCWIEFPIMQSCTLKVN